MSEAADPTPSCLHVLGGCGAWPEPDRACSGFVLEHAGLRIVIDLGYGTLPRLLARLGSVVGDGIDAVIVTHQHPDHMVDLHGLFRARWFGRQEASPLPLYAPRGVVDRVASLEEDDREAVEHTFAWRPLPAPPTRLGPFELTSISVPHHVPTAAIRLAAPDLTVAYTADTGPDPALTSLGRRADLFIVEASTRDQQAGTPQAGGAVRMHLTDREAGEIAAAAETQQLLLTHFWPGNDREASRRAAAARFAGPIHLADEGLTIPLGTA
ncbi:MAG: MBL fold metallo-hydrolase [Candidatus Dormiibacterota bacterium]